MSYENETQSGEPSSSASVFQENQKQLILQSEEHYYKKKYSGMEILHRKTNSNSK